jgi:hypothetical protein
MTEFDGSSGATAVPFGSAVATADNGQAPAEAAPFRPAAHDALTSMLDVVRERVEARDVEEYDPWQYEIKGIGVRLVCDPRIENADYQRWVKSALPKQRGRQRPRGAMDLDQLALSAKAIAASNLRVEVLRKETGEWVAVTDNRSGEVLTLEDDGMLRAFNVMDSVSMLRKLFGRDADVINAGQDLLAVAGYLESDDDSDPE